MSLLNQSRRNSRTTNSDLQHVSDLQSVKLELRGREGSFAKAPHVYFNHMWVLLISLGGHVLTTREEAKDPHCRKVV